MSEEGTPTPAEATPVAPPAPPKVDPETLAIRTKPPRAIRFRRNAIIALSVLGSTGILSMAWYALSSRHPHAVVDQTVIAQSDRRPPEALNNLPTSYGAVPRLGPPLPGDLGKPILEHQQATLAADAGHRQRAEQEAAAERQKRLAELKSARESAVLVHGEAARDPMASPPSTVMETQQASSFTADSGKLALDPAADPNAQQRKADFIAEHDRLADSNPYRLTAAPSPYLLSAGSVISASLVTGLRSDIPGLVTAQVTENVYDSATGRILLIPQGARLVGSYDSVVAFGQSRALLVWQRIILPDGASLKIDNVPAADPSGYAGLADKVDFHTWALLKGVVLSTLLGVSSELAFSGQSDFVQAIRQSTQDSVSRAGDQITSRNLQVQPTITIRPGAPVRLVVHRDLVLAPWKGGIGE